MRKSELALYNLALYATNKDLSCSELEFSQFLADFCDFKTDPKSRLVFNGNKLLLVETDHVFGLIKNINVKY